MRGYLLDVNHIVAWEQGNPNFMTQVRAKRHEDLLWSCAVTIGELESGHLITRTTDAGRRAKFNQFIVKEVHPFVLEVAVTTRGYYAQIMDGIWRAHPPAPGRRTEAHLVEHGVDINDVWAVAVAWEHGLTFLTTDHMSVIRESATGVNFENWVA